MSSGGRVILRGAGARVTATPDLLFRADISPGSLALLFRAGRIPEELQERAKDWVHELLALAGLEVDTHTDDVGSTFTRRSLINNLKRFRRQVAQDGATDTPHVIEQHLLDAEIARLRHERFADRGWGPIARANLPAFVGLRRAAVRRVTRSRGDGTALLALLDDAIAALQMVPERPFEILARRGRLDPCASLVTRSVRQFWVAELGRRRDDLKGLIALGDVIWRLLGRRKSHAAIREDFARHPD